MPKRSLYQCFHAKVTGERLHCAKGHNIGMGVLPTIPIEKLAKGHPLEPRECQLCPEYDEMGPPIPAYQRGWMWMKPDDLPTLEAGTIISDLDVKVWTWNPLRRSNIRTVGEFLSKSVEELLSIRQFGVAKLKELIEVLQKEGYDIPAEFNEYR